MPKLKNRSGFTLIELLVVIAILGIMASIITYGLVGQQRKARDAQRKSDLKQVKNALEAAKSDCRNASFYPHTGFQPVGSGRYNTLRTYLIDPDTKYLTTPINDPKNTNPYQYLFESINTPVLNSVCPDATGGRTQAGMNDFVLRAKLEITNDPDLAKSYTKCKDKNVTWNSPAGGPTADTNSDGIDDLFYYYVCND